MIVSRSPEEAAAIMHDKNSRITQLEDDNALLRWFVRTEIAMTACDVENDGVCPDDVLIGEYHDALTALDAAGVMER
jgi:hypothetical protein